MPYELFETTRARDFRPGWGVELRPPITRGMLDELPDGIIRVVCDQELNSKELAVLADWFSKRPHVELRVMGSMSTIESVAFLKEFPFLERLGIGLFELKSWEGLDKVGPQLKSLELGQTRTSSLSLKILERFPNLELLSVESHRKDFGSISTLTKLRMLWLRSITLPDLSPLLPLKNLNLLEIVLGGTKDVSLLNDIGKIKILKLSWIKGLADVDSIGRLTSLEQLHLESLKHVAKLPSLKNLRKLKRVDIENLGGVTSLAEVAEAPALQHLSVEQMPQLEAEDFRCFQKHKALKELSVGLAKGQKSTPKDRQVKELIPFARLPWTKES